MDKRFIIILAVIILGFIGVIVFNNFSQKDQAVSSAETSNHTRGNQQSPVEFIAYKDFECPPCAQFHPIEEQLYNNYKDKVKFTFKHFPIDTIHANTRAAHRAAEAAGLQGKFFEMQDLIYQNQEQWNTQATTNPQPIFESYAQKLGLDLEKFKADVALDSTNKIINADISAGKQAGVSGTPSFFINGTQLNNGEINSLEALSKKLDEALANNKQ